jgi:hypothetical protein
MTLSLRAAMLVEVKSIDPDLAGKETTFGLVLCYRAR